MKEHLSIQGPQRRTLEPQETITPTQQNKGQDGGRKVSLLIRRFEGETSGTPKSNGPPARQGSDIVKRERSVRSVTPPARRPDEISPSKGPLTPTKPDVDQSQATYNYKEYVQKFGSKTANLYEIEQLGVKVPERAPISSKEILDHLLASDKDKVIADNWEAMRMDGKIDPTRLQAIKDKIEEIFDEGFPFTKDQQHWINTTMLGKVIIARSTGDEDSADTPNAGGNESVLFVEPTTGSVNKAMKEVVLSYFGEDSLRNRIVGDGVGKVLSSLPKMPVLLMEMIAEPILDPARKDPGQRPPIGIAMSTDKAEFTGGENFHFISISSAVGPGVNEGNGRVEVDETFVMQSSDGTPLLIYQKPSVKPERIRAAKQGESVVHQLQKNSTEQAYSPSLSKDDILSLVTASNKIKTLNGGKTTEVEAVVDGQGQINFVQQRAIPDARSKLSPTHVATDKAQGHAQVFPYTTVVPKSGDALVITEWSQVCFAETMKEAEALFDWTGGTQKLVIVRRPDGSNSHPAVNFGSYKKVGQSGEKEPNPIPCLVVPNFGELLALKKTALSTDKPLVIDGQTQKAFVWTDKTFDRSAAIVNGRVSHHIALETSVTDTGIQELVQKLKTTPSDQIGLLKPDLDPVFQAYGDKLGKLEALLSKNADTTHNSDGLKRQLQTTRANFEAVKQAFAQVLAGQAKYRFAEGSHARLLLVKFLESSMHEVDRFPQLIEAEQSASRYLQAIKGSPVTQSVFGDQVHAVKDGLTGPLMLRWKRFLTLAEQSGLSPTQITEFKTMMADLGKLGVTANWMSTVFDTRYAELMPTERTESPVAPKAKQLLEALLSDFKTTSPFLVKQQALQKQLAEVERGMADFASESNHRAAFARLKGVADAFIKEEWPKDLNDKALKKAVQTQTLGRLIEVYDSSIKTLKRNPMKPPELLQAELAMLDTFSDLFESLFTRIDLPGQNTGKKPAFLKNLKESFGAIKNVVKNTAPDRLVEDQSICGKDFNVNNCLHSSGGKIKPSNVEEMFTTLHQSLEEIRSGLMVGGSDYDIDMPEELQSLLIAIPNLAMQTATKRPGDLVGREITSKGVTYTYNMAVLDHGIKIRAAYEKPTPAYPKGRTSIEIDFYASNDGNRLQNMAKLANQFRFGSEPLDDPDRREVVWGDKQFKARFEVRSERDIARVTTLINNLSAYSLAPNRMLDTPKHLNNLTYAVGSSSDPATGKFQAKRERALNDCLNMSFGSVVGTPDQHGDITLAGTDYKVRLTASRPFTFNDGIQDHVLHLDQENLGLDKATFDTHKDALRALVTDEVMVGSLKFRFEHKASTFALDLSRHDLGLSPQQLKDLSLIPKNLASLRSQLMAAWENASFYLPGATATVFRLDWTEVVYGPPMACSKRSQLPELDLWKSASAVRGWRGDLGEVDKVLEKVLEKKYALQAIEARVAERGPFASPNDKLALGKALESYHRELLKCEGICSGYLGMQLTGKVDIRPKNSQGKVKALGEQTLIQRKSIEHRMLMLGMEPGRLTSKELRALPFSAHSGQ